MMNLGNPAPFGYLIQRTFQQTDRRLHRQHLPLSLRLSVRADKYPFLCPDSAPAVGSQLKAFAARLPVTVHRVPQIQLALAAVLRRELDMLFPALIVEADFVVGRGAQDVTFVIAEW